ncbi:hypothetical protein [Loigolactobacillus bifermentans]|uniref:hypothetical protein n=1 Tax=Loigolactobacillus bifermentans TaxID=1607 RepID=UPI0012A784A3|nr:hypothetical protein [Loigolactobacillus bifermentans]QGG59100.1 hypothetical protein LB003_00730 [Loigolactobacillus bifermentans]
MNLLTAIVTAGIPGFLMYVVLNRLNVLSFEINSAQLDKQVSLVFLSVVNVVMSLWIYQLYVGPIQELNTLINVSVLFGISIISTIILIVLVMLLMKFGTWLLTLVANKLNIITQDNRSTWTAALSRRPKKDEALYAILFDFDNKMIASGFVGSFSNPRNEYSLNFYGESGEYSIYEARNMYAQDKRNEQLIDYDKQVKLFLIVTA